MWVNFCTAICVVESVLLLPCVLISSNSFASRISSGLPPPSQILLAGDWAVIGCMQEGELGKLTSIDYSQTLVASNECAGSPDTLKTTSTVSVTSVSPPAGLVIWLHNKINPLMAAYSHDCFVSALTCLGRNWESVCTLHRARRTLSLAVFLTKATQHSDQHSDNTWAPYQTAPCFLLQIFVTMKDDSSNSRATMKVTFAALIQAAVWPSTCKKAP